MIIGKPRKTKSTKVSTTSHTIMSVGLMMICRWPDDPYAESMSHQYFCSIEDVCVYVRNHIQVDDEGKIMCNCTTKTFTIEEAVAHFAKCESLYTLPMRYYLTKGGKFSQSSSGHEPEPESESESESQPDVYQC